MPGSPGRVSNGAGASVGFFGDEDVETVGPDRDAEHRGPRCAGAVGGVGEEVTEAGEPEQAVGPGVVAERELEVGERTVRCGRGMRLPGVRAMLWRRRRRSSAPRSPMAPRPKMPAPMAKVPMSSPCPPEVAW